MLALLVAIGAVAGVIAGLLGVGGGIVLVPAFFYTFSHLGYDGPNLMQVCLATSLATIVLTSARSMQAHGRKGAVDHALLRRWAPAIAVGAVLGTLTASGLRSSTLQLVFGCLALVAGLYLAFGRAQWRLAPEMPRGVRLQGYGGALGFLSVLMGIGGGTFGVPLMSLHGMPIHRAVGTASGLGLVIALPSVLAFLMLPVTGAPPLTVGAVNLPAFAAVIATTLVTTPLGARLAHRMDPGPLKRVFAVFVLVVAANMLRKVAGF
ncbi:MAG: sulfite exporter TauE/SafE family protein [Gemmobacter sp.]